MSTKPKPPSSEVVEAETWHVHILGPDDLMPPTTRLEAMRQAQMFNAASLAVVEAEVAADVTLPLMWAVPQRVEAVR